MLGPHILRHLIFELPLALFPEAGGSKSTPGLETNFAAVICLGGMARRASSGRTKMEALPGFTRHTL